MASCVGLIKRVRKALHPPNAPVIDDSKPIRFGILGAANIAPPALIIPAISHPEAVVWAVGARDGARAEAFAKKYNIPKAYLGYQAVLDDPDVDAIYNPLPNGLHYEWTMKALAAGKHVLLEKPSSNSAEETQKMFNLAEHKGLVLLEAFHYRFHPMAQRAKQILESGELGSIKSIMTNLTAPNVLFTADDIRFNYSLGGGAMMDMGCYTLHCTRYLVGSNPISVVDANVILADSEDPSILSLVDRATTATLVFPNSVTATIKTDLAVPFRVVPSLPDIRSIVTCEHGEVGLYNYVAPGFYHRIRVTTKDDNGKKVKVHDYKAYKFQDGEGKGEEWWTTYRYQLEAFIDKLKGRTPQTWITSEDSIENIRWIEEVYAKTGLGSRPRSSYVPEAE